MSKLNPKTLTIAAVLLMVLALFYVATPLLRPAMGFSGRQTFTGQGFPTGGSGDGIQVINPNDQGAIIQGSGSEPSVQGSTSQGQTSPGFPTRQITGARPGGFLGGLGILSGRNGIIVYAIALLVSLVAAVGMLMTKNWGRVLGIVMGIVYSVIALFSLVLTLLIGMALRGSAIRVGGSLNIWLTVAHLVLAIAVIFLASIRVKTVTTTPIVQDTPPTATA